MVTVSPPARCHTMRHWAKVASAFSGVRSGLSSNLQGADVIQIDLIIFDLARRAMRTEAPLLANNLTKWSAWLGRPSKSEFLGWLYFRLRKLASNPASGLGLSK
jgi:hypothetical protein